MHTSAAMVLPGRGIGWKAFLKSVATEWQRNDLGNVAGSVTFFAILALFPFLLFLLALASLFLDPATARTLIERLHAVAPPDVTSILAARIQALAKTNWTVLLTFSGLGALFAATGGVASLMNALNRAYAVRESRPYWKVQLIALASTVVAALLSLLAMAFAVVSPTLVRWLGPLGALLEWLRLPVAGLLMMLVWALLYYFLPDVEQEFRFITPGSVTGVIIWLAASWLFSLYVVNLGKFEVTYGTLGGVVVMLLWMWISSQVVLLGAEINAILEQRSPEGKRRGARTMQEKGVSPLPLELPDSPPKGDSPLPGAPSPAPSQPPVVRVRTRPRLYWLVLSLGVGLLTGRRMARQGR